VKYARARTYFESNRWEEAAMGFKDVADNYPNGEFGIFAANLYLESINVLTFHGPKRAGCVDDMIAAVPKFIATFCTADKLQANADTCSTLTKVQCDIQRLHAYKLVEKADATPPPPDALQIYAQAGKEYFDLWQKYGAAMITKNEKPQCEKLEEIVYNSAKAFQAGHLVAMAISARKELLNPQYTCQKGGKPTDACAFDPDSDYVKDAVYQIGGNYQAIAVYDQAADYYERYAKSYKDRKNADQALNDAIVLRLGLGDEQAAIDDATTYRQNYGAKNPDKSAAIQYGVAAHYAEKSDWDHVKSALNAGTMVLIDRAPPDIQVQAHATLARAYAKSSLLPSGRPNDLRYKGEYARVVSIWSAGGGDLGSQAIAAINKAYPTEDDATRLRRVGKSLDAVGEAIFSQAEDQKASTVDVLPMPIYQGNGQDADVLDFIKNKVKPWLTKKFDAIGKVDHDYYQHVTDLKPKPPPRWVIAAASRSGLMWASFVDEFRASPIPDSLKKDDELRGTYYQHLDEQSQPLKDNKAKPALVACLNKSVEVQYFDQFSRDCETWLAKNYKSEYHIVDELRGAPTLSNSGLDDRPPPLIIGGNLWHPAPTGPATEKAGSAADSTDTTKKP
jgi:tetratricopeptide (TPR) repeat protein